MDIEELKQDRAKTLDLLKRNLSLYDLAKHCIESSEESGNNMQMLETMNQINETIQQTLDLMHRYCEESVMLTLIGK